MAPGFDPTRAQIGAIQCSGEKVSSSSTPSAPRRPAFDAKEATARRLKREAEHRREKEEKKRQREREVQEFRGDRLYRGVNGARATGITDAKWAESFGSSGAADREKRVVVFNGPGGRHDSDGSGNCRLAVLFKDPLGDSGRSILDAVAKEVSGFGSKVEQNRGRSAAMAACVSGVARVGQNQQFENKYTEILNTHPLMGPKRPKAVESLKALCYDRPMALLGDVLDPGGGVVDFQSGKYRQDFDQMKTFNHGQVLVHLYEKQGMFKNHFDQNSQAVALWSVGHSAVPSV